MVGVLACVFWHTSKKYSWIIRLHLFILVGISHQRGCIEGFIEPIKYNWIDLESIIEP